MAKKARTVKRSQHGSVKLREKKLKNGDGSYYLDVYHNGQRHYEFLKLYTINGNEEHNREVRLRAMEERNRRERDVIAGTYGESASSSRRDPFLPFYESLADDKDRSWHIALRKFKQFLEHRGGPAPSFAAIDKKFCEEYQTYLLNDAGLAANSAAMYYSRFRAVLNAAVRADKLASNPCMKADRKIKQTETVRPFLTLDEVRLLQGAKCPNDEVKRAFLACCFLGLRFSDARKLTWDEVHPDAVRLQMKKTAKVVEVPLNDSARLFIGERRQRGRVFDLPTGPQTNRIIIKWAQRAGITKDISFHVSRHTFAMLGLAAGIDVYTMKELLGHAEISSTLVYAKIQSRAKHEAIAKLPTL